MKKGPAKGKDYYREPSRDLDEGYSTDCRFIRQNGTGPRRGKGLSHAKTHLEVNGKLACNTPNIYKTMPSSVDVDDVTCLVCLRGTNKAQDCPCDNCRRKYGKRD